MKLESLCAVFVASLPCLGAAQTIGDQGPLGILVPGIGKTAPPPWVKTGLRLSYHVETATVAGLGQDWKEDEDGTWKTEDGKHWTPSDKGSNAAEGFLQFDLTALGPSSAAVLASFYLVGRVGESPKLSFQYPIVGLPATVGGPWVNPTELKKVHERVTPTLKVVRMQYRLGNASRRSVWIRTSNGSSSQVYVYDEATGILLHDASTGLAGPPPVTGKNEINSPSQTLSDGTLVDQRVLNLPWLVESAQGWSSNPPRMDYSGSTSVPTSGGPPLVLGQELSVRPTAHGAGWVLFDVVLRTTNRIGMPASTTPSKTVSGLGQFGGAWLPPAALAKLEKGQRLDSDPVTGMVVSVQNVTGKEVTLVASSAAQTTTWGYDLRSGLLSRIEKADHNRFAPIRTQLRLAGG